MNWPLLVGAAGMWDRPAEVARPDTGTAGAAAQLEQLLWRSNTAKAAVWRWLNPACFFIPYSGVLDNV